MPFGDHKSSPGLKKNQENDCAKPCAIFKQGCDGCQKTGKAQTADAVYIPHNKDVINQQPFSCLFLEKTRLKAQKSAITRFASLNRIEGVDKYKSE